MNRTGVSGRPQNVQGPGFDRRVGVGGVGLVWCRALYVCDGAMLQQVFGACGSQGGLAQPGGPAAWPGKFLIRRGVRHCPEPTPSFPFGFKGTPSWSSSRSKLAYHTQLTQNVSVSGQKRGAGGRKTLILA
eukprot:EG_transcript_11156